MPSRVVRRGRAGSAPSASDDAREHDVVDRAAQLVLDRLEPLEVAVDPGEAPVRPDRRRSAGCGAPRRAAQASAPDARTASSPDADRAPGAARGQRARRRARSRPARSRARAARRRAAGRRSAAGRGIHGVGLRAVGAGSGAVSKSTVVMSTPETPSTSAWCVLAARSRSGRPPGRSTSQISHSGLARSSCCENSRPARSLQLGLGARARQRRVADVVADVEVRVVDPHRPALLSGTKARRWR